MSLLIPHPPRPHPPRSRMYTAYNPTLSSRPRSSLSCGLRFFGVVRVWSGFVSPACSCIPILDLLFFLPEQPSVCEAFGSQAYGGLWSGLCWKDRNAARHEPPRHTRPLLVSKEQGAPERDAHRPAISRLDPAISRLDPTDPTERWQAYGHPTDPTGLVISLSLHRHPFVCISFSSRFTCYNKYTSSSALALLIHNKQLPSVCEACKFLSFSL